jgi:hypothetical protein
MHTPIPGAYNLMHRSAKKSLFFIRPPPKEMIKRKGHYSGTEIDEKWWTRYRKDHMFARGAGEYWYDGDSFYFRRYLTKSPIAIKFSAIKAIKTGNWHAGRWAGGRQIVKILWEKEGINLSSGFILSESGIDTEDIMRELRSYTR